MENSASSWLHNLQISDLEPVVCQLLDQPAVEILDWQLQSFSGGAVENLGEGLGVHRITGTARYDNNVSPWSVVLKALRISPLEGANDPTSWLYWKREAMAYQSGVLDRLPGDLAAAKCYAIQEINDGTCCLWLEYVQEDTGNWTMAQHRLAARHLGQFNGAYLAGHPLPEPTSWMLPGRTHQWLEIAAPGMAQLQRLAESEWGHWLSQDSVERMIRLWANRESLLAALDRLPTCFCHHDAFRRNLIQRTADDGAVETVAIDWSFTGPGKVGQEIAIMTAIGLQFMEVAASEARELDHAVFEGYIDGLCDAGWQGDRQLVRFGYAVTAALTLGVAGAVGFTDLMQSRGSGPFEAMIGCPIEDIMAQWTAMHPFLLDLGDEALVLMPSI
jgi:hypothetical protein